jgi:putative transcriptional regulator
MRPDGSIVEVLADDSERPIPDTPMRPMTPEEVEEAARADPDARPMTLEEMTKARRVSRIKTLRRALGLTQEEFAARYRIPLGTLRDWEQGRSEPDQPARAYLNVIAHDPESVRRALEDRSRRPQSYDPAPASETIVTADLGGSTRFRASERAADKRRRGMQVKTVTYTEVIRGTYVLGFKKMDTHMAEMLNDGWRVQSQTPQAAGRGILPGVRRPGAMLVTYVKD